MPDGLRSRTSGVTAERLYTNQKVSDLVTKAETEQNDYRRGRPVNVFFGPVKTHIFRPHKHDMVGHKGVKDLHERVHAKHARLACGHAALPHLPLFNPQAAASDARDLSSLASFILMIGK